MKKTRVGPGADDFLKEHLNLWWLRPESALWDAAASAVIARAPFAGPALDLGCGNGLFSFVTAGGSIGPAYDWFVHSDAKDFAKGRDIYDVKVSVDPGRHILRAPRRKFDWGLDHKASLLSQAARLGFYGELKEGNAQEGLDFEDGSFGTVFSNILYWLKDPAARMKEISRLLRKDGCALLCLPDPSFKTLCASYQWKARRSEFLRLLSRGRADCHHWTARSSDIKRWADAAGLRVEQDQRYLSPETLAFWDFGLRPLSPALLEMARRLKPADRADVKALWIESALPILRELLALDARRSGRGGFHFAVLRKR